jgi:hypothetical protein
MAEQHDSTAPVISTPCHDAFFPAATSSADIKVCCLLLFVSYLSLRDILLKTLSAMEREMFGFSHNNAEASAQHLQDTQLAMGNIKAAANNKATFHSHSSRTGERGCTATWEDTRLMENTK